MKLKLNTGYAFRHLAVAGLLAATSLWSIYDGAIKYPADNKLWEKDTGRTVVEACAVPDAKKEDLPPHLPHKITEQFYQAGVLALLATLIAGLVGRESRKTLSWDDTSMTGSITGNRELKFSSVASCDWTKWAQKRIVTVSADDKRKFELDAWHHSGVIELAKLLPDYPAEPKTDADKQHLS